MPYRAHAGDPVKIVLRGRLLAIIQATFIRQYLPSLSRACENSRTYHSSRILNIEKYLVIRDTVTTDAIQHIFYYLQQISQYGESAALLEALENIWNRSYQDQISSFHGYPISPIEQAFSELGRIFDKSHLGCNSAIFQVMASFFISHCSDIMYDDPEAWIEYVYALDRMRGGKEMINVLSCIHQHPRFHDVDLRTIEYITTAQSHQLSHRTIRQLRKLCHMRTGRQPHRQMELRIRDRSYERSPRYLAPPPLHLEGSKILMDPISGVTERMHKGSHIHPEELLQICEQDPSSILVKDRGLHGLPFNNPHYPLELEDDYGSETSTERGERLSEEPWDYPGIVQPPWDARSGSPFRGHHRPVRVIRAS